MSRQKRTKKSSMRTEVGDIEASGNGIANTFANMHEDLYSSRNIERKDEKDNEGRLEDTWDITYSCLS